MTSRNFDPKVPSPLCHPKMCVLPTSSYRVSQKYIPPSPLLVWRHLWMVPKNCPNQFLLTWCVTKLSILLQVTLHQRTRAWSTVSSVGSTPSENLATSPSTSNTLPFSTLELRYKQSSIVGVHRGSVDPLPLWMSACLPKQSLFCETHSLRV